MELKEQKFFLCKNCNNVIGVINDAGLPLTCCGEKMEEIIANSSDASKEKHLPKIKIVGDLIEVQIGEVMHPMLEEHYIQWVYIETQKGGQRKCLLVGEEPKVKFSIVDDKLISVFAYCNIHGLWRTTL